MTVNSLNLNTFKKIVRINSIKMKHFSINYYHYICRLLKYMFELVLVISMNEHLAILTSFIKKKVLC